MQTLVQNSLKINPESVYDNIESLLRICPYSIEINKLYLEILLELNMVDKSLEIFRKYFPNILKKPCIIKLYK